MAYDETLAERIRQQLANKRSLSERKMFGGIAFMLKGNMCCGVLNKNLIVRVPKQDYEALMKQSHTAVFDMTGKAMKGFIVVKSTGLKHSNSLKKWLRIGTEYAQSLPAKK